MTAVFALADRISVLIYGRILASGTPDAVRADPQVDRRLSRRRDGVRRCWRSTTSRAAYGPAQVLFDVSFSVGAGEVVTLLGRNGMGKTTTIRTLMGLLPATGGDVTLRRPLADRPAALPHRAGRPRPGAGRPRRSSRR